MIRSRRAASRRLRWLGAIALVTVIGGALLIRHGVGGGGRGQGAGLNVLLVTLDTTRADRLGCYGHRGAKTPHLDRLAAEGARFENAFADAPITLPSHASLLTGLHPFEHGVRNNGSFHLPERFETLATLLRRRGYRTAAFVSSFILDRRYGLARGFESYDDSMGEAGPGSSPEAERRGDRTALACTRWLEAYAAQRASAPFFVWMHLYDPHEPYRPPPPLRDAFADQPYDGEIAFTDLAVASVLETLAQLGLLGRSLVAVIADHGESLGDHGEETHSMFLYESAIRVPLILWRPGVVPAGRVVSTPVGTVDLAPTILDILGEPPLTAPHARSLRDVIEGRSPERAVAVYAETYVPKLYMNGAPLRALRDDRFKLIEAPRPELYDLARDPGEMLNRFEDQPAVAERLRAELQRLTAGTDAAMSTRPVDDEAARKLKALGYLGAGAETAGGAREWEQEKDPKDLIAVFNRLRQAERAVRDRRFDEALPILRAVVAEEPRNAFAHQLLGGAYVAMRQHARAVEEFRAYLALVPNSAQAHQWMAVGYANLGDQASALREAGSALVLDPHLSDARLLRAGILSALGRRAEAVRELRAAVVADPGKPPLRLALAEVLLDTGQAREAEAEYRAIVDQDPAFAPALAGLGALLVRRGALEEASAAFRRALELDPRQDEARFNLAGVLERQGHAAAARAEYERLTQAVDTPPAVREAAKKRLDATEATRR